MSKVYVKYVNKISSYVDNARFMGAISQMIYTLCSVLRKEVNYTNQNKINFLSKH